MQKHMLIEKKIDTTLPKNWEEWLALWGKTSDPLSLLSLLRYGPKMDDVEDDDSDDADILYLRLAKDFYKEREIFSEEEVDGDIGRTIFNSPKSRLAKEAFRTLCKHGFSKTEECESPWERFVYTEALLDELLVFLGLDNIEIQSRSSDEFHGLLCYSGKYEKVLEEFCIGLACHLISAPLFRTDDKQREELLALWRPRRRSAVKILWYFGKLEEVLIKHRDEVDDSVLKPLREMILSHDIVVPVSTRSSKETLKRPKEVIDVLKIKPDSPFWSRNQELIRAAHLYLGLTS